MFYKNEVNKKNEVHITQSEISINDWLVAEI